MSGAGTEFRFLGPVEVHHSPTGRSVVPPGIKQQALLATLVVEAGHTVSMERLADELWEDRPPRGTANAVQAHIARLRRLLGSLGGAAVGEQIETRPTGYLLRLGEATVDAERFRRLSAEGRAIVAADPGRAAALLDRALSLWRGPALADCRGGPVCAAAADRLEEQRLTVLEVFYEARLRTARPEGITGELERLAEEHPLRERFYDLLMMALHRADRRSEALAVYERARRRLATELGVEPGPSLRGRWEALLRHEEPDWPPFPPPKSFSRGDGPYELTGPGTDSAQTKELTRIGTRLEEISRELRHLTLRFEELTTRRP